MDETVTNKIYYAVEGSVMWESDFHAKEDKWTANSTDYGTEAAATNVLNGYGIYGLIISKFSATKDGEEKVLDDLYSAFTYSDGFYTATLYNTVLGSDDSSLNFTVSLKDGYLTGVQFETKSEFEDDGFDLVNTMTSSYVLSNVDKTTVTAPEGALAAIEAAKNPASDGSVAGKTFVFDELILEYDASVTEEMKQQMEAQKPGMQSQMADVKIIFGNNGDFSMIDNGSSVAGTYTQNGDTVVITPVTLDGQPTSTSPVTFTVSGNILSLRNSWQGVTQISNFRLQTA